MRLTWADLAAGRAAALHGHSVEIDGFLCPFTAAPAHRYFALAPEAPCSVGCLPAEPSLRIEVFADAPITTGGSVRLTGTWHALDDDPAGWRWQLRGARPIGIAAPFSRRGALAGALLCLAVPSRTAAAAAADGRAAIADQATVDIHSHAGRIIGTRAVELHDDFRPVAEPMRAGGMAVLCLATVSDSPVHRVMQDGRIHPFRDPAPGELYAYGQRNFQRLHDLVQNQGLRVITDAAGLAAARADVPSVIVAAEGADFLEGRPERVDEAYAKWRLRHLQLTHYRVNELGDIQTEAPVHGGLTEAGAAVIRRCNQLGLVVDVAHGTYDLVKRAATVTTKPLVLSHTSLSARPGPRSRTISADHARAVAATGGVIGVWPPASIFPDLAAMASGIARMVDVVGIDHVGLGSDMQGLVGPSVFPGYTVLPDLAAALLAHGFAAAEVRKLLGENYIRVFRASLA
jgi:membrane dipeptidase